MVRCTPYTALLHYCLLVLPFSSDKYLDLQDDLACGPFVEVPSAYNALNDQLRSMSVFGYVSSICFTMT